MKKAFTLAEVLITLVVIGIVAAITINIIFSNQDEAYRSALKKTSSTIQNAFRKASLDNGGFLPVITDEENKFQNISNKIFKPNMRVLKDCRENLCFWKGEKKVYNFNGTATIYTYETNVVYPGSVILQDGTFIAINSLSSGTGGSIGSIGMRIDTNGIHKGPNRLGKDVFNVRYDARNERLVSTGTICDKTSTDRGNGNGCFDVLLRGEKLPR